MDEFAGVYLWLAGWEDMEGRLPVAILRRAEAAQDLAVDYRLLVEGIAALCREVAAEDVDATEVLAGAFAFLMAGPTKGADCRGPAARVSIPE